MYFILSVNNLPTDFFLEQKKSCFVQQILFWSPDPQIFTTALNPILPSQSSNNPCAQYFSIASNTWSNICCYGQHMIMANPINTWTYEDFCCFFSIFIFFVIFFFLFSFL